MCIRLSIFMCLLLFCEAVYAQPDMVMAQESGKKVQNWSESPVLNPVLEVVCELGTFELTLYSEKAPLTVTNFLRYVDSGFLNNTSFYRTVTIEPDNQQKSPVKIEVIQGGWERFDDPRPFPDIQLETTKQTGVSHRDGTISMARDKPDSASTDCLLYTSPSPRDQRGSRMPSSA